MAKLGDESNHKTFYLDGFNGAYKAGAFYRSRVALDVDEFENKFQARVVGMTLTKDYDSDKPSWNVEFLTEASLKDIQQREEDLNAEAEYLESKAELQYEQ